MDAIFSSFMNEVTNIKSSKMKKSGPVSVAKEVNAEDGEQSGQSG